MISSLSLLLLKINFIPQKYDNANYYVTEIALARDSERQLEIAFFDNSLNSQADRIKTIKVNREYEQIFIESGLELEVKYPIELFGLSPFPIHKL
jgi:hypothetical protein